MFKTHQLCVDAGSFSLKKISLEVGRGDYFILLGPTGSGKTMLLETIAGIRREKAGEIWMDNAKINQVSAEQRNISLVYQDCALFPHLSVAENIVFGLRIRRENPARINSELKQIAEGLNISSLLPRKPETLSGGERHKVALARSLIVKPRLLLLDEPFSALDPETRESLRQEIRNVHQQLGLTIIHVTHDFEEAMSLGQHMAVLDQGQIQQVGTPEEIFRKPACEMVARFTQTRNIFAGQYFPGAGGCGRFQVDELVIAVNGNNHQASHACIRPGEITLSLVPPAEEVPNTFAGQIIRFIDTGPVLQVVVNIPPVFHCQASRRDLVNIKLLEGQTVYITFRPESVHLFE